MPSVEPDINKLLKRDPVNMTRGAPMGAGNFADELSIPLLLQRIQFVDGAYAPDGTYWGCGKPLWCAFNPKTADFKAADGTRIYVRATTLDEAAAAVRQQAARLAPDQLVTFSWEDGVDEDAVDHPSAQP